MKDFEKALSSALRSWSSADKSELAAMIPYRYAHHDVKRVPTAKIATRLGPFLNKVLTSRSRLRVIGYDGNTLADKGYRWRRLLTKWLTSGCSIDYFISVTNRELVKSISELVEGLPPGSGRLRVFKPKESSKLSENLKSEMSQLRTFHFVVSDHPETLWIETNHPTRGDDPTNKHEAFDCYFFPESAAKETGLAEIYIQRFQTVLSGSDEITLEKKAVGEIKRRLSIAGGRSLS